MIGAGSGEAENGPDEDFTDGFFITTHGKVGKWWCSFDTHSCAEQLEKMPVHE